MVKRKYVDNIETEPEVQNGLKTENGDEEEQASSALSAAETETLVVHHVPFKLEFEGKANVNVKFTCKSVAAPGDSNVLSNQYRGRPLQGQKMELPKGYEGLIATDLKRGGGGGSDEGDISEVGSETEIALVKRFDSMTYWNWDRIPSGMDKHVKLMDWIEVSQALHEPVDD